MSKNYDMIATVDIDVAHPITLGNCFDNLLIMGPPPKNGASAPDVGAYADISDVTSAGFVVSGDNADPVGVAARIAFEHSSTLAASRATTTRNLMPMTVYIATQKRTEGAEAAAELIEKANAAIEKQVKACGKSGCRVTFNKDARCVKVSLTTSDSKADWHGIFEAFTELVKEGCAATIDGTTVESDDEFKKTACGTQISAMKQGDDPISFCVKLSKEGTPDVLYAFVVSYPNAGDEGEEGDDVQPLNTPETELEDIATTIQRAMSTNGWYVLCTAGVDPAEYENIATLVETQEKMFCYTELGFFGAGEGGENKPAVSNIYYRTMGIYGRERTNQDDEDVPEENNYINVAWAAKWLNYESGSETSAFKALSTVYPSELTTAEIKALEAGDLNYFVTIGSKNLAMNGKTRAGEWADVIRFRDWLKNDIQLRVVSLFASNPKVPYTDAGIALVQNQMIAALKAGQDVGGIAESEFDEDGNEIPGYTTSVPLASSLSSAQKTSRKLTNCTFKAKLTGAIHFAEIAGSLTYEL